MGWQITFVNEKKQIEAGEGITILEAMRLAGLSPDAPCGGQGRCGKCEVLVRAPGGNYLRQKACRRRIDAPLEVKTFRREEGEKILLDGGIRKIKLEPDLHRKKCRVPACARGDNRSDWDRLCLAIGKDFAPSCAVLADLSPILSENSGWVEAVYTGERILALKASGENAEFSGRLCMAAFDVGTTTVAGYLLDAETGETLAEASSKNPQAAYGADVISRASVAIEQGAGTLSGIIRACLDELLFTLCREACVSCEEVYQVAVVGNTCMHHLFLGIHPGSLVLSPYNPVTVRPMDLEARDFLKRTNQNARLLMLPVIAGFVGADTVACQVAVNLEEEKRQTLLIDIGTNGELVMGNGERRIACSTAAGPAFEGARISCGMRGAKGAIDHVTLRGGSLNYSVIGGGKPSGLCGSGLIDLVAELLENGLMDESGRLLEGERIQRVDDFPAYLLADETESAAGIPFYLTQRDIREVQLAKGALAAGICLLAGRLELTLDDIEQVYLAGAFGNYMNSYSACRIGLLPMRLKERILPVGNAAGNGAKLVLLSVKERARAERLARNTEFLELASLPQFQDMFIDKLEFPEI